MGGWEVSGEEVGEDRSGGRGLLEMGRVARAGDDVEFGRREQAEELAVLREVLRVLLADHQADGAAELREPRPV
jgi:hypothetical protein